jgi:hypothetical protein
MWPYTHDESNWLAAVAVDERTGPRGLDHHSIFAIERAARRYRAQVIAGMLASAAVGLWRFVRRLGRSRRRPAGTYARAG